MGFGIMFLGYFAGLVMFLGYLSLLRVLGGIVIGFAAYKLRAYNKTFDLLLGACVVSILFYGVESVFDVADYIGAPIIGEGGQTMFSIIGIFITFIFHMCMLFSIRAIAKETDSPKIVFGATRNIVFYVILLVLQLITLLPYTVAKNMSVLAMIVSLVLSVFNLVLIFRCYAQICDESDLEMERKPSRFAFVNRFREESERKQREAAEEREAIRRERDSKRKKRRR